MDLAPGDGSVLPRTLLSPNVAHHQRRALAFHSRAVWCMRVLAVHAMPSRLDMRETGQKSRSFLGGSCEAVV